MIRFTDGPAAGAVPEDPPAVPCWDGTGADPAVTVEGLTG
jgi:hypothetical protein